MSMVLAVNEIFDSSSAVLIFRYCRCFLLAECFMNVNFDAFAKTVCLFLLKLPLTVSSGSLFCLCFGFSGGLSRHTLR